MVGREGFEPSKAEGRQIYSLMRLTASLPPRRLSSDLPSRPVLEAPLGASGSGSELAEGIEPPTR